MKFRMMYVNLFLTGLLLFESFSLHLLAKYEKPDISYFHVFFNTGSFQYFYLFLVARTIIFMLFVPLVLRVFYNSIFSVFFGIERKALYSECFCFFIVLQILIIPVAV